MLHPQLEFRELGVLLSELPRTRTLRILLPSSLLTRKDSVHRRRAGRVLLAKEAIVPIPDAGLLKGEEVFKDRESSRIPYLPRS